MLQTWSYSSHCASFAWNNRKKYNVFLDTREYFAEKLLFFAKIFIIFVFFSVITRAERKKFRSHGIVAVVSHEKLLRQQGKLSLNNQLFPTIFSIEQIVIALIVATVIPFCTREHFQKCATIDKKDIDSSFGITKEYSNNNNLFFRK